SRRQSSSDNEEHTNEDVLQKLSAKGLVQRRTTGWGPPENGSSASTRSCSTRARRCSMTSAGQAHRRSWPLGVARAHLWPAGQQQIALYLRMLEVTEGELDALRGQLDGAGRFSSARKAVRFTGLGITVYSSDGKRSPGHLSRQGPPVPRWCAYEAGKTRARAGAPGHGCYAAVKDRKGGKRAALSEARKIVRRACRILGEPGDDAFATACPGRGDHRRRGWMREGAVITRWGTPAAGSRQSPVRPARAL